MPSSSRTFRVFVSSTFSDLETERSALQERVFPKLKQLCLKNGCRFQAIDLRWGIRKEAGYDQQTMKICIEEIKRCQKTNLKPNFIVLLGDKYGWQPVPAEIVSDEFEKIRALASKEEQDLLDFWYKEDKNAKPSDKNEALFLYCLQPRDDKYRNEIVWLPIERQLRSILTKGALAIDLSQNDLAKYFASATEQEINQGLSEDAKSHVFCFLRNLTGLNENPNNDFIDIEDGKIDQEAQTKLKNLKSRLKMFLSDNVKTYEDVWDGTKIAGSHIDALCSDVERYLSDLITQEVVAKGFDGVDSLNLEIHAHDEFGKERSKFFVGRVDILNKIRDYLKSNDRHPLAVVGDSGSGKTSLIAHATILAKKDYSNAEVVFRFIGATPSSTDGRFLIENLCKEISQKYLSSASEVPNEYSKLVEEFNKRLAIATVEKPLIVFIDALDQLSDADNARNLLWLPSNLPDHVRIIVSCLPNCSAILEKKLPYQNILFLRQMSIDDGKDLLNNWLYNSKRCLQPNQEKAVLDNFAICGLPLYLKFAFEEARKWKSYTERIELSPTIPGIITNLFKRLSSNENYGEKMFSHCLCYLAAAKNGLTEDELLDILSLDVEVFNDFKQSSFHKLAENRLPIVVWSRMYHDLEPYLIERNGDGTTLLGFYHRQLYEAVIQNYFQEDSKTNPHAFLVQYFTGDFKSHPQPLYTLEKGKIIYNTRKLSELPYQETQAKLWSQLEATLTDMAFIDAKCGSGMTYDLILDYETVFRTLPGNEEENRNNLEHKKRIKTYIEKMVACSRGEISIFEVIPSIEIWDHQKIKDENSKIFLNPSRLDKLKAFSHFISSEVFALEKFSSSHPAFCLQQSYNFASKGFVANSAETSVDARKDQIMFLRPKSQRQDFNVYPALLKTLESEVFISNVCLTYDGKMGITHADSDSFRVWNLESGESKNISNNHSIDLLGWCCTPDGKIMISAGKDGTLGLWDMVLGECKKILRGRKGYNILFCSPDGKVAVTFCNDEKNIENGTFRVWDMDSGACKKTINTNSKGFGVLCCTADGKSVISTHGDGTLRLWDMETGECKKTLTLDSSGSLRICCTADGKTVLSTNGDGTLRVWDMENGKCKKTLTNYPIGNGRLCCTHDGKIVITKCNDNTLQVWAVESGKCIKTLSGHITSAIDICCTPDGKTVVSTCNSAITGNTLRVWDIMHGECTSNLFVHHSIDGVSALCSVPHKKLVISAGKDSILHVWDIRSEECKKTLVDDEGSSIVCLTPINSVCCSPDGLLAFSASGHYQNTGNITWKASLRLWDLDNGECKKTLQGHTGSINVVCCTPDGKLLLSGGNDFSIRVWDIASGECRKILTGHSARVKHLCCTPDGKLVISACLDYGGADSTVRVWDIESGKCKKILTGHTGFGVRSLCCAPDGKTVISAGYDTTVRVWDIESGECKKILTGHSGSVNVVLCAPDGKTAITASDDKTVRVWDIESGECKKIMKGHTHSVNTVDCSSDGKLAISGASDNTLRAWDIVTGECVAFYLAKTPILLVIRGSEDSFVCGEQSGEVVSLQLHNYPI